MQKRPTPTNEGDAQPEKPPSTPFGVLEPIAGMRAGWYYNPIDRAVMHSPSRGGQPHVIGFVPKVIGLVTARSEDGKHNGIRYLIDTIEGPRIVSEDELDTGTWAGKIGVQKPSGRDAVQAFATMIRKQSLDTPEVPSRVYRGADGALVMPEATSQDTGYRVTCGEEDGARDFWAMAGYFAHGHGPTALALGAAFAAPLLEVLGLPACILNLVGEGQCGKSTTQVVQACLYGSIRGDVQQLFRGWDTSKQGLPQLLREVRFLPIFREEFSSLALNLAAAEQLLSVVVAGATRTTGGKDGTVMPGNGRFHSLLGSSSNRPLRRPGQTEDLASRLYELTGPYWQNVFVNADGQVVQPDGEGEAEHLSQWLKRQAADFAGWPFEWAIGAGVYSAESLAKWRRLHRRLANAYGAHVGGVAGTIAGMHAAWVVGAHILGEVIEIPELAQAADAAARELLDAATVSAVSAHLPAGHRLWDALDAARVAPLDFPDIERVPGILEGEMRSQIQGFTRKDQLWVLPACLEVIARKADIENVAACIADMKNRGVLVTADGKNDRKQIPRPLWGFTKRLASRMYCFSVSKAEEAYGGPQEDEDQEQQEPGGQGVTDGQDRVTDGVTDVTDGVTDRQQGTFQALLEAANLGMPKDPRNEGSKDPRNLAAQQPEGTAVPGQREERRPVQAPAEVPDLIGHAVAQALETNGGDVEAATAALVKRAIPDAMKLLDVCRTGARYEHTSYLPMLDVLKKTSSKGSDQIWEARPKFIRKDLRKGPRQTVTALDMNGAYLSALKTHLPIGALQHSTDGEHNPRRSGVHLVTPPEWNHTELPNPLGDREEPGQVWITEATLRLLLRLSTEKYGRLCEAPVIHESYTSGASENLLEKFRRTLRDAREAAIASGDEVTLEYVKSMYSKFVSTIGESNANHDIRRPDWMHIIRSQAFSNLWMKAMKAHNSGLTIVKMAGTDELHVVGDWQQVFPEGRGVSQVKVKDEYEIGEGE